MNVAIAMEPPAHAFAAACSWWASSPRDGFTDRAWGEWERRMRFSRYAQARSNLTGGYRGPSSLDQWKHRKALEASR